MKPAQWLKRKGLLALLCAGVLSLSVTVSAREDIGSQLPPDVRVLLIQEMIAVLEATLHIPAHHEHPFRTNVNTNSGLT